MVNNSTRPDIIANKWTKESIYMMYNEEFLVVEVDMEMYKIR